MKIDKPTEMQGRTIFVLGTRAELIKIEPIVRNLNARGFTPDLIWLGLHASVVLSKSELKFNKSRISQDSLNDLPSSFAVGRWLLRIGSRIIASGVRERWVSKRLRSKSVVVVHGDTLCTLLGGIYARIAGIKLAHIEAGLRTNKLFSPFPEEINRRLVSRMTNIHFAPGPNAVKVCLDYSGKVVDTKFNTALDTLSRFENSSALVENRIVVTLHRAEFLANSTVLTQTIDALLALSNRHTIAWFAGEHERSAIASVGRLGDIINSSIVLLPRLSHKDFIEFVISSKCVLTDSGGLQYECMQLEIPVIVHRTHTEYPLASNSRGIMTNWDVAEIEKWIEKLEYEKNRYFKSFSSVSPSKLVSDYLIEMIS